MEILKTIVELLIGCRKAKRKFRDKKRELMRKKHAIRKKIRSTNFQRMNAAEEMRLMPWTCPPPGKWPFDHPTTKALHPDKRQERQSERK
jgi:deoxyribodipyrimidine photolyase-like uncharacterized protein